MVGYDEMVSFLTRFSSRWIFVTLVEMFSILLFILVNRFAFVTIISNTFHILNYLFDSRFFVHLTSLAEWLIICFSTPSILINDYWWCTCGGGGGSQKSVHELRRISSNPDALSVCRLAFRFAARNAVERCDLSWVSTAYLSWVCHSKPTDRLIDTMKNAFTLLWWGKW